MMAPRAIVLAAISFGLLTNSAGAQTVQQLQQQLAAKDAEIAKLEQRLHALEKQTRQKPKSKSRSKFRSKPGTVVHPVVAAGHGSMPAPAPAPAYQRPPPAADDDEMDRALERTLVREGALVLAPYTYELTPQFSAAHWDRVQDPVLRNSYAAAMTFRMGLPWRSQLMVTLPFVYNELANGSSSGLGDAGFLFSKELLVETDTAPNLVGSIGFSAPANHGGTFGPVPYVSGFQAGVTAAKRLDPLVVFGSASYYSAASREIAGTRYTPSDVFAWRTGASLAVTPATSITTGISFAYLLNASAADFVVPNSDRLLSTVDIGFSTIVWRRTLLNVTAQFGLTGHVPDLRLITSLPVRF